MRHPDDKCCAVEMPDGFAHVFFPNWDDYTVDPEEKDKTLIPDFDDFMDHVCVENLWASDANAARAMRRVYHLRKDVPPQSAFLAARKLNAAGDGIEIDMAMAREIKTGLIRRERNDRLDAEDKLATRALEKGDTAERDRIIVKKQTLRDLPATIAPDLDAIAGPAELDAWQPVWPE